MTATAPAQPGYFDRALPALARAAALPEALAAAEYVGAWLAVLAAEPGRLGEFNDELDAFAADLHRRGVLIGEQRAGFLLALWVRLNHGRPLDATHAWVVAERKLAGGWVFCKWRGWLPRDQFDAWRYDQAAERAARPNKGERAR